MSEPSRIRRAALTLAEIGLWISLVLLLLLVATFAVLGQGWGSGVVNRILALATADFSGRITVENARVFPDGTVIATHAKILDPEGRAIIEVERATAHADWGGLIGGRLRLSFARASGVKAAFTVDDAGDLNIARAFQPRHPQPPSAPGSQSGGFAVTIDDISVDLTRATLTLASAHEPVLELQGANVTGRFELTSKGEVVVVPKLTQGEVRGPLAGQLAVAGRMTLVGPELTVSATASLGDSSLDGTVELNLDKLSGVVGPVSLVIGPRTLSLSTGLEPQKPRGGRVTLLGRLEPDTAWLDSFSLRPLEGPGEIRASGKLGLGSGNGEVHLSGRGVDARALFGSLPTSSIGFELEAAFEAIFAERRSASVGLHMDTWRWDGEPVGPGELHAQLHGRTIHASDLDLDLPGAHLIAEGELSDRHIRGRATIDARNLGRLRSAIASISHIKLPEVDGDAAVRATVDGSFRDLALHADLRSRHASLNGLRAHDLVATVEAPRIGSHMDLRAHVLLGELQVADEILSQMDLNLSWQTPELSLLAKLNNRGQPVTVSTRLLVPANLERADLENLDLHLPGADWKLELPAHLDFKQGVSFKDFHLTSGPQDLRLSVEAVPDQVRVQGEVQNLELARLPFIALRGRKLSGTLTAAVQYQEGHHHRNAQAQAQLSGLSLDRLHVSGATLNASLNDSHLITSLDATVVGGKVRLRFDGPLPTQPGNLDGQLQISELNAADFATLFPELKPYSGSLAGELTLAGSWASPEVHINASAEQLKGPWMDKPGDGVGPGVRPAAPPSVAPAVTPRVGSLSVELQLSTTETLCQIQGRAIDDLQPNVDLLVLRGRFGIGSKRLGALLRKPSELLTQAGGAPLTLEIKTGVVPLGPVGRMVPVLSRARGTAQLDAELEGSPRALRGSVRVAMHEFGFPHRHLGSVDIDARLEETGLSLRADVQPPAPEAGQPGGGRATITASWGLRTEDLGNANLRRAAPLRADVQVTDLPLAVVLGRRSDLQGLAKASAEVRGSLGSPSVKAQLALTSLRVLDKPAGTLDASAEWNGRILLAVLNGDQPTGGALKVRADLPLTTSGLGTGPITGQLEATAFDLSIFEPILVQTRTVRALRGTLTADLTLAGTRAAPEPKGTLSLTQGQLALAGLGELQHVALSMHVDPSSLSIDRLEASSGGGQLTAHLSAIRGSKDELAVSGHLETKRFGIYADDQLRALLDSTSDLSGKVTFPGPGADVTVSVHHAAVQIPTLTQRDLAPTTLDPEIHLGGSRASDGEPAESEQTSSEPRRPIYLRVEAPEPIEVRGPDVQLTAKANLAARITSDVDLTGMVAVQRGEVNALGRTFKIYRANVAFGDAHGDFAPPSAARLNVQAGQEIDGYRITMVVLGRLDHPVPQLSSDPPLPQAQISQMLATGSNEGDTTAQSQAGGNSIASNLLVEGMKTWLKINPPVDVLTVDPNRLEAGKRITRRLYLGVTNNYAAVTDPRVNGTEVHARYELGHHFALDGRYGTSQAGSFDLQWRHNW